MEPAMKPMTPDEASTAAMNHKIMRIPEPVVVAFNELIMENWNDRSKSANVSQDDVIKRIMQLSDFERKTIFNEGYLDVEPLFEQYGWEVTYDKPAYNENYTAFFIFKKKS